MWVVDNKTPFEAAGTFQRDKTGAEVWIVAVKASFDILPGNTVSIAKDQMPLCYTPVYTGKPGQSSLKYDRDLVLDKPATDIILNGQAVAPNDKYVKHLAVAMKVADINKKLIITGDRTWQNKVLSISKSKVAPFKKMPIVYERTCGGTDVLHKKEKKHTFDPRNPVGTGFAAKSSHRYNQNVPNIVYKEKKYRKKHAPAGFGPIPCHWEPRSSYGGTYDTDWERTKKPLMPDDFDMRFNQHAPVDQQVYGYLKGGETVELINLHPQSRLSFKLPDKKPESITLLDNRYVRHEFNLHTVIIEPDSNRLMMVWHTALECHHKEHLLKKTTVSI